MRCPVCGTQNETDSRFCGGCGARVNGTESRLAPTEKINSDAPLAVQPTASIPPGVRQASAPEARRVSAPPEMPRSAVPLTKPGTGAAAARASGLQVHPSAPRDHDGSVVSTPPSPRASNQPLQAAPAGSRQQPRSSATRDASRVSPPRRSRWGLVVLLLLCDFGLAGSGGWMLWQGLHSGEVYDTAAPAAKPVPAPAAKPVPPPTPAPAAKTGAIVAPAAATAIANVAAVEPVVAAKPLVGVAVTPVAVTPVETASAQGAGEGTTMTAEEQANEAAKLAAVANDSTPAADPATPQTASAGTTKKKKKQQPKLAKQARPPTKGSTTEADGPLDPYGEKP